MASMDSTYCRFGTGFGILVGNYRNEEETLNANYTLFILSSKPLG